MNNKLKWIILAVVLVVLIAAAGLLYNKLGDEYASDNISAGETKEDSSSPTEDSAEDQGTHVGDNEYQPAPDFTVMDYDGNEVKLSDFKGTPVVLNFWATWCYYCMEEMPDFNKASLAHPEVQFLMVNATDGVQETLENAKAYIDSNDYHFKAVYDTKLSAVYSYQVNSFPTTFFINAEGELVAYGNGMMSYETVEKGIGMITE